MGRWRVFLDSLDSDGGQIFVMCGIVAGCFWMLFYEPTNMKAGELLTIAAGALIMKFKSSGSNREQTGSTSTVSSSVQVSPVEGQP